MMDPALVPLAAQRFRALSDPGRLELLAILQHGERSVGDLVRDLGRNQPNVSQQLGHLAREGLVASRREGQKMFYRVTDPFLEAICDAVCRGLHARSRELSRLVPGTAARTRRRQGGGKR